MIATVKISKVRRMSRSRFAGSKGQAAKPARFVRSRRRLPGARETNIASNDYQPIKPEDAAGFYVQKRQAA
ncbi:hypothetical protein HPQ64_16770 [Rhizobiales bacterium]|uniref:hypothetical protein n=1 Tax=Hongsoonwoonella zoysiae TaxID=2821844 RepID=UPI00155FC430|nr:hypothetical protein [Hongsoonwoonella zoysiae]NRG19347.1 hypothetical protein [Hongsoonwoonella zoysiae]